MPAATDLLIAMGESGRLVAVSNYEPKRASTDKLPRVGDYQTTDWERLRSLHPTYMIVQIAPDRMPAGLKQKADELGIKLVNVQLNRLDDITSTWNQFGQTFNAARKADDAILAFRQELDRVRSDVAKLPKVKSMIVVSDNGEAIVGPNTFLDDVLSIAGGENVAAALGNPYPSIDREKLIALNPDGIIQLLPDASQPVLDKAKSFWQSVPQISAVKNQRITIITDSDALLPASGVARLARKFALALHPQLNHAPATKSSTSSAGWHKSVRMPVFLLGRLSSCSTVSQDFHWRAELLLSRFLNARSSRSSPLRFENAAEQELDPPKMKYTGMRTCPCHPKNEFVSFVGGQ